jgi:hypothetical protein
MIGNSSKAKTSSWAGAWVVIPLTLAMVGVVIFVFAAVQHNYRQSANDPQIQLAGDIATQLSSGTSPLNAITPNSMNVDPRTSLGVFEVITDVNGVVQAGSLKMDNTTPTPPKSVLAASSVTHQNRITWQPESDVSIALVVQAYKHGNDSGYVLVGRSLNEVERRISTLFWMGAVTMGGVMLLGCFAFMVATKKR